jgi:aminopeptidase-like protein
VIAAAVPAEAGTAMHELMTELYPICRSITGEGYRTTMAILAKHLDLDVREVPSGTQVFDWTIPREWNIRDAYVANSRGERVIDFRDSNLHVVSYSVPVDARMSLTELRKHLHTMPEHPDWIPYRTSYYAEDWGFCLTHRQLEALPEGSYHVVIDSSLSKGHLTWGECLIEGASPDEVLLSAHACHPSLCNDNLSGVVLATFLAKALAGASLKYSYRFLFVPGTIGAIAWLAHNEDKLDRVKAGLVLTCVGDGGGFTYKRSRRGDAEVDRVMSYVLATSDHPYELVDFSPYGYDERQFCSPGFNLPVGSLNRTPYTRFPEYHTSADNLDFVRPEHLAGSYALTLSALRVLEENDAFVNLNPKCEPQLGRHGLYGSLGGGKQTAQSQLALLWVLNLSDGEHSLLDVAERSGLPFELLVDAANALLDVGLLARCEEMEPDAAGEPAGPGRTLQWRKR